MMDALRMLGAYACGVACMFVVGVAWLYWRFKDVYR